MFIQVILEIALVLLFVYLLWHFVGKPLATHLWRKTSTRLERRLDELRLRKVELQDTVKEGEALVELQRIDKEIEKIESKLEQPWVVRG
jgi:cell division protein FtsB